MFIISIYSFKPGLLNDSRLRNARGSLCRGIVAGSSLYMRVGGVAIGTTGIGEMSMVVVGISETVTGSEGIGAVHADVVGNGAAGVGTLGSVNAHGFMKRLFRRVTLPDP